MSEQLDIFESAKRRDSGIARAINHAGKPWADTALQYVDEFIKCIGAGDFMMEDVANWAYGHGLERPPHARAWGAIALKAQSRGFIRKVGYGQVKNIKAHRANASVYVKA